MAASHLEDPNITPDSSPKSPNKGPVGVSLNNNKGPEVPPTKKEPKFMETAISEFYISAYSCGFLPS